MSQEKQRSISSTPAGESNHCDGVIALGRRLVEELDMEPGVDTLGRWMAHYIAELIEDAEQTADVAERQIAQERCCTAILRLWEHRSTLPRGARPLANLQKILDAIIDLRERKPVVVDLFVGGHRDGSDPLVQLAISAEEIGTKISRIALLTAIAEAQFGREKRWVDENGSMLSEEEKNLITYLDDWLGLRIPWQTNARSASVASLVPEERTGLVIDEIAASLQVLHRTFDRLKAKEQ